MPNFNTSSSIYSNYNTNYSNIESIADTGNASAILQLGQRVLSTAVESYSFPQIIGGNPNQVEGGGSVSKFAVFPKPPKTPFDTIFDAASIVSNTNLSFEVEDQRSYIPKAYVSARRLDGASAAARGSVIAGLYAAASITPGGAYKLFNRNGNKYFGAGWGEHSNPGKIRNDFTLRSHVATRWIKNDSSGATTGKKPPGYWQPTLNPIELVTAFTGDRVSVIDFKKRKLPFAYTWNPVTEIESLIGGENDVLGSALDSVISSVTQTQDFVKFYFTGPKLYAGNTEDSDDIMVFRAIINSLSDSFQPQWSPVPMIGRADPNYQYTGFARDLNVDFTVYATSRDELKPIWRKLNALAGYTAPIYDEKTIGLKGPWMRVTIGDLFVQQPVVMTSLTYTLYDSDTPWEINIEHDPTMMQVPIKIGVQCNFNLITDNIPKNGGKFYTLAKKFGTLGVPAEGNHNWLSDFGTNSQIVRNKLDLKKLKEKIGDILDTGRPKDQPKAVKI